MLAQSSRRNSSKKVLQTSFLWDVPWSLVKRWNRETSAWPYSPLCLTTTPKNHSLRLWCTKLGIPQKRTEWNPGSRQLRTRSCLVNVLSCLCCDVVSHNRPLGLRDYHRFPCRDFLMFSLHVRLFFAEPQELAMVVKKSKHDRNETLLPWCFKFQEAYSSGNPFFPIQCSSIGSSLVQDAAQTGPLMDRSVVHGTLQNHPRPPVNFPMYKFT